MAIAAAEREKRTKSGFTITSIPSEFLLPV
jgi:hypothetical protein